VSDEPAITARPAAHRRLGLVALLWAYRALAGLLVALPAVVALGGVTSQYPRGQAELFDAGGVMLLETLRLGRRAIMPVFVAGGSVAIVAVILGLFPLAAVIAGLGREGRLGAAFLAGRAAAHAGTIALLFGLGVLAEGVVAVLASLLLGRLAGALHLAAPGDDLAAVAAFLLALLAAAVIGVIRDLAFVAAVHGDRRFYGAAVHAVSTFRRAPLRVTVAWAWRSLLGLVALGLAAWLAPSITATSGLAALAALALHQIALFAAAFARASWLAAAIRFHDARG
jgi:hypothetical protein